MRSRRFACSPIATVPSGCRRWMPSTTSGRDRKSTRLNSSHLVISYAVFCLKKKKKTDEALKINLLVDDKEIIYKRNTTTKGEVSLYTPALHYRSHYTATRCKIQIQHFVLTKTS